MEQHVIRPYKKEDFKTLQKWYLDSKVAAPQDDMLSEDGTFILYLNGIPALSQTLLMTKGTSVAYFEYLIKNPQFKGISLEQPLAVLRDYIFSYAKDHGYKYIFTYGNVDKLKDKYERMGFTRAMDNLSAFYRSL